MGAGEDFHEGAFAGSIGADDGGAVQHCLDLVVVRELQAAGIPGGARVIFVAKDAPISVRRSRAASRRRRATTARATPRLQ